MSRERALSAISVERFRTGEDDFEEWIQLFESSIVLGTNASTDVRKIELYLRALPLKLDDEARALFKQCTGSYAEKKEQMIELLTDPQEEYKWHAKKAKITWDGKESFHKLTARVKKAVDKYDKLLDGDGKAREYFFRFRNALPKNYRDAIDLGCGKDNRTIDDAKDFALRVQMTQNDDEEGKSVTFTGAGMSDDRLKTVEFSLTELGNRLENIEIELKKKNEAPEDKRESRGYGMNRDTSKGNYPNRGYSSSRDFSRENGSNRGFSGGNSRNRESSRGNSSNRDFSRGYRSNRDFSRGRESRRDSSDSAGPDRRNSYDRYRPRADGDRRNNSYDRYRSRYDGRNNGRDRGQRRRDQSDYRDSSGSFSRDRERDRRDYRERRNERRDRDRRDHDKPSHNKREDDKNDQGKKDNSKHDKREKYNHNDTDASTDVDASSDYEAYRAFVKEREKAKAAKSKGKN